MTFNPASTFDRAEAAVTRLLENGRVFVGSGRVAEMVKEMADDAEVEVTIRAGQGRGWWISL